jgi:hypothetical protein
MTLNAALLSKADPLLREALQHADRNQVLRVVLLLRTGAEEQDGPEPLPSAYPSRIDYRRALIERQRRRLQQGEAGRTLQELEKLQLDPQGGGILPAVVVEGPVDRLAKALQLPGVVSGSLDRPIELVRPRPSEE